VLPAYMIPETQDVPAILASSSIFLSEDGDDQSTRRKPEGRNGLAVRCSKLLTHFSDHSVIITMRANPDPSKEPRSKLRGIKQQNLQA
jgi:hypothetical protein